MRQCFDQFDDPDEEKVEGHNVDEEQVAGARLGTSAEDRLLNRLYMAYVIVLWLAISYL